MKWVLTESDAGAATALAEQAGIHPLIARLMANRGIADPAGVRAFLSCELSTLSGPGIFVGMQEAAGRIRAAISDHEKIAVYGDYDVDGVTGAALLFLVLKSLQADVISYIPDRISEGYGLHGPALNKLKSEGVSIVITADCGISALDQARTARSLAMDLIVTDHHELIRQTDASGASAIVLPEAYAVLHPKLVAAETPEQVKKDVAGLTGVGMAFKLAQALLNAQTDDKQLKQYLDLVALGTIADVGAIIGENRILVKHGLDDMSADNGSQRKGVAALKEVAGLAGKKIGVGAVGFSLAPRINASGRLNRADAAFRLLTTDSPDEARELASMLDDINRDRQAVEELIQEEARRLCRQLDIAGTGALVLASADWHPGVIGIVASRIVEEFYRPAALISIKDGIGKGSARSIPGFDLYQGLSACSDLLLGFGGHKYAAGFTVAEDRIPELRERLGLIVLQQMSQGFIRTLAVDGAVALEELTLDLMHEIDQMAPFGQGNPEPRLGARGLTVLSSKTVRNNHLKLQLRQQGGGSFGAIFFSRGGRPAKTVVEGSKIAVVFTPRINVWNGRSAVELEIRDIKIETSEGKKV
ncbi:MAG: single-stranded-DNA-specific exonuclease RecJ [Nitrospirae bacterium GWC2_56_14]|nr:MAG: single-stranded-DNA-specific exonuclease RecJ [Nitrospirae bacterium GWC2_56_14]